MLLAAVVGNFIEIIGLLAFAIYLVFLIYFTEWGCGWIDGNGGYSSECVAIGLW